MRRERLSMLAIGALLAVSSTGAAAPLSGLRGSVVLEPSRPVCIEGRPCSAPAPGVVLRFGRDGRVRSTTTRGDGTYRVVLAPGRYAVSLAARPGPRSIAPRLVRVVAGTFTRVDFTIDTGIQ